MDALALDLATRIGWAYGSTTEQKPASGVHVLPQTGEELGPFFSAYHNWLIDVLNHNLVKLIVFEAPMPTQAGRSTMATTLKLQGLCSHTEFVAYVKGIETRQVNASTWKKSFCGDGRAAKPKTRMQARSNPYKVITACHERGWYPRDDNEADALGIWAYTCSCVSPEESWHHMPLSVAAKTA